VEALSALTFGNIIDRFSDVPRSIIMQFIGAFGLWIIADRLQLSGVHVLRGIPRMSNR
jgi:hypothetical protein